MTSQREVFLASEGDAWFRRNEPTLAARDWGIDEVCRKIYSLADGSPLSILEIGCGDGSRLQHLARTGGHRVSGIDPSAEAVAKATARGVTAVKSTADQIPFDAASFDVVVFGFCLYLCDDTDLFRIAAEADRVCRTPGWLLILDFDASAPSYRPYIHCAGIQSRKMDNKSIFLWHPAYTLASLEKFHHSTHTWTDDPDEWVSLACLRKRGLR
jgi:ubiquinone/menaquinone biosynthesis C-methylase UbiE